MKNKRLHGAQFSAPTIKDKEIRKLLHQYFSDEKIIIDEVKIKGGCIADLLVINPLRKHIIGVEIKSSADDTQLLYRQLQAYKECCSAVVVVTTYSMLNEVLQVVNMVGDDIGIMVYYDDSINEGLEVIRNIEIKKCPKIGTRWVSRKSKLAQYLYLLELEEFWGL